MRQFSNLTMRQLGNWVIVAIIASLLIAACKDKNKHLPQNVMQNVLTDITMAEGYSTLVRDSLHPAGTKNYDSLGGYYKQVFAHYKITQEQFNESLNWYKKHPEELDSIYARMQIVITKKSAGSKQTAPQIPPPAPTMPATIN